MVKPFNKKDIIDAAKNKYVLWHFWKAMEHVTKH